MQQRMTSVNASWLGRAGVLLVVCGMAAFCGSADAGKFNAKVSIGDAGPVWAGLPNVDGKEIGLGDLKSAPVVVIAFTCNHCPVAQAYEERFKRFVSDYGDKGVVFVAISASLEDVDSPEAMRARAKSEGFNFPYLFDGSQKTARAYGAAVTPHVFVLDQARKIAYMGAFDDDWEDADKVKQHHVRAAVDALLAGKSPAVAETQQIGCGITYQK